jgi:hypothetical protein
MDRWLHLFAKLMNKLSLWLLITKKTFALEFRPSFSEIAFQWESTILFGSGTTQFDWELRETFTSIVSASMTSDQHCPRPLKRLSRERCEFASVKQQKFRIFHSSIWYVNVRHSSEEVAGVELTVHISRDMSIDREIPDAPAVFRMDDRSDRLKREPIEILSKRKMKVITFLLRNLPFFNGASPCYIFAFNCALPLIARPTNFRHRIAAQISCCLANETQK